MPLNNFERLVKLADEVFAIKNDPDQLDVNQEVIEHLKKIHPATVSEYNEGNGPVAWVLVIPTTEELMNKFLEAKITEKELYELTPLNFKYDAIYLCSALILEEYRRKGIMKKLLLNAIETIQQEHPIKSLFVWPFSKEGDILSDFISRQTLLVLKKRFNQ